MTSIWKKIDSKIRLQPAPGSYSKDVKWSNADLDPIEPERRTWGTWDVVSYWTSDQFAPATFELGSSLVALGLTLREIVPLTFFGFLLCGLVVVAHSKIGAHYHIPFPVSNRAVWGPRGSYLIVFARSFLALMWLTILSYTGGNVLEQLLISLSPRFGNMPNTFPESAVITSRGLLCFFLYIIIQTPFLLIPIQKLKYFFAFKAIVCPPAFIAIGIWSLVMTSGGGVLVRGSLSENVVGSSARAWACLKGMNAVSALYATVSVNVNDFVRFSRSDKNMWIQAPVLAITGTIPVVCGILAADASLSLYGKLAWAPDEVIAHWQSRPAVFFGAVMFLISIIGVNISANGCSFACDIMSVAPQYINLFRGGLLAAVLSAGMVPWLIVSNANAFLNFLGAYGCWLGPIMGVILVDFYIMRHQRLDVRELYLHPGSIYSYNIYGFNGRAFIAFIFGFAPNIPGFINAIAPSAVTNDTPTYRFNWLFGITVSAFVYWFICSFIWALPSESLIAEAVTPDDVSSGKASHPYRHSMDVDEIEINPDLNKLEKSKNDFKTDDESDEKSL